MTVEDAEELVPGAYGFAVLVGQDAGDLGEVREVVDGPRGEELREGDFAEGGVNAAEF